MRFSWISGPFIEFGRSPVYREIMFYYIGLMFELSPQSWDWGYYETWYVGPHKAFHFGPIIFSWTLPWTKMKDDING